MNYLVSRLITLFVISLLSNCVGEPNYTDDGMLVNEGARCLSGLRRLQQAYPQYVIGVNYNYITWNDGSKMDSGCNSIHANIVLKNESPVLADQVVGEYAYLTGKPWTKSPYVPTNEPGRSRYIPLFQKMYGFSKKDVESNLTNIYWMPKTFGNLYPLSVTKVNNVDTKFIKLSNELDALVASKPENKNYLSNPAGTFCYRLIAGTNRLSAHSFGMTIDINTALSDYWRWDLEKSGVTNISERSLLTYKNQIPQVIIDIFEQNHFIWGGKWYHYDTMHFEYRPELFL